MGSRVQQREVPRLGPACPSSSPRKSMSGVRPARWSLTRRSTATSTSVTESRSPLAVMTVGRLVRMRSPWSRASKAYSSSGGGGIRGNLLSQQADRSWGPDLARPGARSRTRCCLGPETLHRRQGSPQRLQPARNHPVPDPCPPLLAVDQASLVENPQMVADRRLRPAQRFDEGAGAHLPFRLGRDETEETEAGWVGLGGEAPGQLGSIGLAEG